MATEVDLKIKQIVRDPMPNVYVVYTGQFTRQRLIMLDTEAGC